MSQEREGELAIQKVLSEMEDLWEGVGDFDNGAKACIGNQADLWEEKKGTTDDANKVSSSNPGKVKE